jgi:hypothetical protein
MTKETKVDGTFISKIGIEKNTVVLEKEKLPEE